MASSIRARLTVVTTEEALGGANNAFSNAINPSQFVTGDVAISMSGLKVGGETMASSINFNDLIIFDPIGKGSCSTVRLAIHKPTGIKMALKEINVFDQAHQKQLVGEVKSLFRTDCPAIIKFFGAFLHQDRIYVALEYMDGGSLGNVLAQVGALPEFVLANMTFQVLWGLCYLKHEHRIHRDIKPQNILINSAGQVKLTDFGLAKELISSVTMGKTFIGSYRYMAPERLQNLPHTYASDIWALGIVLYEMAVGRSPFAEDTENQEALVDIVQSVVYESVPFVPDMSPLGVPFSKAFQDFLGKCLAKNPEERLTPDRLLTQPWLVQHGAVSLTDATTNVRNWIASLQPK